MTLIYIVIGLAAGVLAGLFGIGGGILIVPALAQFAKMPFKEATGTSLGALLLPVGLLGAHHLLSQRQPRPAGITARGGGHPVRGVRGREAGRAGGVGHAAARLRGLSRARGGEALVQGGVSVTFGRPSHITPDAELPLTSALGPYGAPFRKISGALYLTSALLIFIPIVDFVTSIVPYLPASSKWRFASSALFAGFLLTPLLGVALAMIVAGLMNHRFVLRWIGILSLLVAVGLVGRLRPARARHHRAPGDGGIGGAERDRAVGRAGDLQEPRDVRIAGVHRAGLPQCHRDHGATAGRDADGPDRGHAPTLGRSSQVQSSDETPVCEPFAHRRPSVCSPVGCPARTPLRRSRVTSTCGAPVPLSARVRSLLLPASLLAAWGCGHSEPFQDPNETNNGPFSPAIPIQLTYNPGADLTPAFLPGDTLVLYSYEQSGAINPNMCIGALPVAGGTRVSDSCPRSAAALDSTERYQNPVPLNDSMIVLVQSARLKGTGVDAITLLGTAPWRAADQLVPRLEFPFTSSSRRLRDLGGLRLADRGDEPRVPRDDRRLGVLGHRAHMRPSTCWSGSAARSGSSTCRRPASLRSRPAAPGRPRWPAGGSAGAFLFTLPMDTRVYERHADGSTVTLFDFGTDDIARDPMLVGNQLVAIVGGTVTRAHHR